MRTRSGIRYQREYRQQGFLWLVYGKSSALAYNGLVGAAGRLGSSKSYMVRGRIQSSEIPRDTNSFL
jgi:hypothetical protein